jgi:3D (Asp-Asp-Asp) domain-containing protein
VKEHAQDRRKLSLARSAFNAYSAPILQPSSLVRLTLGCFVAAFLASCATNSTVNRNTQKLRRMNVRTTAYCTSERGGGGKHNAIGMYLSGRNLMSAASDWSRFPLGTRFRLADTNEEYIIDDYGGALVGTSTIDLFKNTRREMKSWGVRHVDIDILQWGSEEQSLKILGPRAKHKKVRRMLAALNSKKKPMEVADKRL